MFKVNIDKSIFRVVVILIIIKFIFSYLNVELVYWQRHLTPNFVKYNFFNLPQSFTKQLEYLILPLLLLYNVKNFKYLGRFSISFFVIIILFILNIITGLINNKALAGSLQYTLKLSAPIFLFFLLVVHHKKYQFDIEQLIKRLIKIVFILTFIGFMFFDKSYNHDRNWLPIYFASLHTHNYMLAGSFIGVAFMFYKDKRIVSLLSFLLITLIFLYFGYRIRSAMVFYLFFFFGVTFKIHNIFKVLWAKILLILPVGVILILFFSSSFNLNKFSSGRVSMYKAKYEMIKDYNALEYLFGRGKGSDYIKTDVWWYQAKNSHNDLLTFSVENGFIYSMLYIILLFSLFFSIKRFKFLFAMIILGYLATSFLSNGISIRTTAGYNLFFILAYIYIYSNNNRSLEKINEE